MSEHESQSPFNAVPPVVVALAVFILGIECVFYLAEQGIIGGPARRFAGFCLPCPSTGSCAASSPCGRRS